VDVALKIWGVRCGGVALATAGVASTLLVACGEGGDRAPTIAAAAAKSEAATTQKIAFHLRIDSAGQANDLEMSGTGAIDRDDGESQLVYDLVGYNRTLSFEIRILGNTMYQKYPPLIVGKDLPAGKPWVRLDLRGAEIRFPASLLRSGPTSPTNALAIVGAGGDVDEMGTVLRRGASTTHYKGSIRIEDALEQGQSERQQAELQNLRAAGTATIPFDIWLDGEGFVRALRIEYENLVVSEDGIRGDITLEFDFFDFEEPVDVERPPASQTSDFLDVLAGEAG
jgi:hypothetical protein